MVIVRKYINTLYMCAFLCKVMLWEKQRNEVNPLVKRPLYDKETRSATSTKEGSSIYVGMTMSIT